MVKTLSNLIHACTTNPTNDGSQMAGMPVYVFSFFLDHLLNLMHACTTHVGLVYVSLIQQMMVVIWLVCPYMYYRSFKTTS